MFRIFSGAAGAPAAAWGRMTEFQEIYARYARDVHRFVLYLSGDPALAEDITSEAFVRLWTSEEKIRMLTVKAYLFAIARHLYIDSRRTTSRRAEIDPELPEPGASPEMRAHYKAELREVLKLLSIRDALYTGTAQPDAPIGTPLPYCNYRSSLDLGARAKITLHSAAAYSVGVSAVRMA